MIILTTYTMQERWFWCKNVNRHAHNIRAHLMSQQNGIKYACIENSSNEQQTRRADFASWFLEYMTFTW